MHAQSKVYSIQEITSIIDGKLSSSDLTNIDIQGEIIAFNKHTSGHIYLTLKDKTSETSIPHTKKAIIRCTFFSFYNKNLNFEPTMGMEVQIKGSISVYYPKGEYSFNIISMYNVGLGNLLLQVQQLKKKLIDNNIIDPNKKKKIPLIPKKIGIITGLQTAAIKDIYKQIKERYSNVNVLLAPARMQGEGSVDSIVKAIIEISKEKYGCELIILTRGGGSIEDLMPYNEEKIAMAIYNCSIPFATGIGHHIDHPIADDVADLAGSTPTDVAKQVLPIVSDYLEGLSMVQHRTQLAIQKKITFYKEKLTYIVEKPFYKTPFLLLKEYSLHMDSLESSIQQSIKNIILRKMNYYNKVLNLDSLLEKILLANQYRFKQAKEKLIAFSPLATLKRGYSIISFKDNILNSSQNIKKDDELHIQFFEGSIKTKVL